MAAWRYEISLLLFYSIPHSKVKFISFTHVLSSYAMNGVSEVTFRFES